jgi:predicted RNA methylase
MRLEGIAKAGFYPTPPQTLRIITRLLVQGAPQLKGRSALDPCAGEGEAIATVGRALGMKTYGLELDQERAATARKRLYRVRQGDALRFVAQGFSLLWLNPPYDYGPDGERLEETFLKRYLESLVVGGVLVLLVPEYTLEKLWPLITANHLPALVARLPEPEYRVFKQVVVVAQRAYSYETVSRAWPGDPLPYLDQVERLQLAKTSIAAERPELFEEVALDPEALIELVEQSPLWEGLQAQVAPRLQPLLPLKAAHLALLVAGGMLDLETVEIEGTPHLLLGVLKKDVVQIEGDEERVERQVFRMGITALNLRDYRLLEVS